MSHGLIDLGLVVLAASVALNLLLTLRLAATVRTLDMPSGAPFALSAGEVAPPFEGRALADGRDVNSEELKGQAVVLVFLSVICKKCRKRMPELSEIMQPAEYCGVSMWVIGTESARRLGRLLRETPLRARVLDMRAEFRQRLNPKNSSPFYVFIDHRGVVQASNFVGDDDWESFVAQMREPEEQKLCAP